MNFECRLCSQCFFLGAWAGLMLFAFVIVLFSTIGGGSKRNKKVKGGNDDHRD